MNFLNIIFKSCLICVILYSCLFSTVYSQNLIKNPGFESGTISPPWSKWFGDENSSITVDTNNVYSGNFCAKLTGPQTYLFQLISFEPNTTYKLSATIKTELGDTIYLGANDFGGNPVSKVFNSTNFKTDTLTFTTDVNLGNSPKIYIWKPNWTGSIWVDDVVLTADTTGKIPDEPGGLGTYYVSQSGNDLNSGTSPAEAWQTIEKVNRIDFEHGDRVLFEGNQTFIGNIRFRESDSGIAGNKVAIGSYGTGRATIDAKSGSGLTVLDCQFLVIKNINFKGDGRKTGNLGNGIIFNYCSEIIVDSVEIQGFRHSGLRVLNTGSNYRLTNIYSHNNGYAGIHVSGIDKLSLSNIYIGNCVADNNPGDPSVTDNHSGNGIFVFNAKKILIEYCKASNNGWDMPRTGNGPGGIWVAEVDSAIIQHCISHDNKTSPGGLDGLGFDFDGGTTNSVIQYCLSYNNQGAGFGIFQYNGATDWKNNTIRYCVSENDGNVSAKGSILIWNGSLNANKFKGLEFYNNVVYNENGPALAFTNHSNFDFNFRNNIFISKAQSVYNGINNENFQANCWYSVNDSSYTVDDFNQWAVAANKEMFNGEIVGKYGNPLFINPGNSTLTDPRQLTYTDDYKVNKGSLVTDAGLDLSAIFSINPGERDFYGNPLINGVSVDMGIFESPPQKQQQDVIFNAGWNIFSVNAELDSTNFSYIANPLIQKSSLVKIQDQSGNSLEDWGIFGGWINNIGNIRLEEGYKVKVIVKDSLSVIGTGTQYPFAIPLRKGWNIVGYPQTSSFDGMENIVKQLIDGNILVKVQDDRGNSIEDWGIFGGWQNNIGDFVPGKGYKIKVISEDTLWINESYTKSTVFKNEKKAITHFQPIFEGNGVDHMNINLVRLPVNIFQANDELAVYDGENCVGAITLMPHHLASQTVSIAVSANDFNGMKGFTEGNPVTLKFWNSADNHEFILETEVLKGNSTFTKHETTFLSLEKLSLTRSENVKSVEPEINCFPNPFSDETTLEINLKTSAMVEVEVFDQLGQKTGLLLDKTQLTGGIHKINWNGENSSNRNIAPGIYYIRITVDQKSFFKKVVNHRNN